MVTPVYGDHRIAGNPVQAYKAEIRYEHPSGIYFGPNVEWNIVKYPVDEANTLFADPYALLGFRAGYRTQRGFAVYFEARNLLNKTYAAYVEPLADAGIGDDNASFSPGARTCVLRRSVMELVDAGRPARIGLLHALFKHLQVGWAAPSNRQPISPSR